MSVNKIESKIIYIIKNKKKLFNSINSFKIEKN